MTALGFIGLGVMGEAMCRNLARKSGAAVAAFDPRPEPLARLAEDGVEARGSVAEVTATAEVIFLSLPGGDELEAVVAGPEGIHEAGRAGQIVVDHTTAPVGRTRELAALLADTRIGFLDAPVARTRAAAVEGTLAMTVGGADALFAKVRPFLDCMASDVIHVGDVGCGQIVKLMNNMVLIETVVALADALTIGERAGLDGRVLFEALAGGSADSFALRNHGMKALLPRDFPAPAFSAKYALKDLRYALELAEEAGVPARAARVARDALERAIAAGHGEKYFPVLLETAGEE